MKWISKKPPQYYHPNDTWVNEADHYREYVPCFEKKSWVLKNEDDDNVVYPFSKKDYVLKNYAE